MCGRFVNHVPLADLQKHFNAAMMKGDFTASYNIAPTQIVPVVVATQDAEREIRLMKWGLVPSWARDKAIGNKMINARAETVAEKPAYRKAFEKRRCIVPASGFYEWDTATREPYYFTPTAGFFSFAGLWESWKAPDGIILESFTILTTQANETVGKHHQRMPVALTSNSEGIWLSTSSNSAEVLPLLSPFPNSAMNVVQVTKRVNSPLNNDPLLLNSA